MKANARTVIDLILKQGALEGAITEVPKYKMKFAALWSMSDTEKANDGADKGTDGIHQSPDGSDLHGQQCA